MSGKAVRETLGFLAVVLPETGRPANQRSETPHQGLLWKRHCTGSCA